MVAINVGKPKKLKVYPTITPPIQSGEVIVRVCRAGTLGLAVLHVAKIYGERCIIADLDTASLERAVKFGADETIHSTPGTVKRPLRKRITVLEQHS